ncbi:Radical SAM superfamily protein [Catalinimonas alkaloidigena]|uniref:Radical SAM superfamily protein n=1 Tax=Catalinimonas alkaloidigena TaxID=1075417 RepID=A0A1G9H524_9BACT|nr:radical SAM protein [Catalinimonas alkaloidigena]SDL07939.1 Radical SAM superfamily protein [Catalinimonas alkaloidigena]
MQYHTSTSAPVHPPCTDWPLPHFPLSSELPTDLPNDLSGRSALVTPYRRQDRVVHLHCTPPADVATAPHAPTSPSLDLLKTFLRAAWQEGYDEVVFTGGEPFLYPDLGPLLRYTRRLGFKNRVVTHGLWLDLAHVQALLPWIDLTEIRVDGPPPLQPSDSFARLTQNLQALHRAGHAFGLVHVVTDASWASLLWLADFAYEHGARELHLRPPVAPRKNGKMTAQPQELLYKTFLIGQYLKSQYEPAMRVELDLWPVAQVPDQPRFGYLASVLRPDSTGACLPTRLSDVLPALVVDEQGNLMPLAYGVAQRFRVGHLSHLDIHPDLFDHYLQHRWPNLQQFLRDVWQEQTHQATPTLLNWNDTLVARSTAG